MGFKHQMREWEQKWQEEWEQQEIFQVEPDDRDKFFITVAYPYPSGGMHIGHVRTYTLPDVFGRFKRMQGYNVLFPMAWHVTGTPIIGAVNRLKNREEKQLRVLTETYNIPENDLKDLETPMGYARYFINNSYRNSMKALGFGVDWRREFTTNDERYNKFIHWQYRTLRDKDLVKKGKHPAKYCLNDKNAVTTHDLLEGEDAEKQEYILVKFKDSQGRVLPMATLRPETVYGVTHALVNPKGQYVEANVDGQTWIVSREAVKKLEHQDRDIEITREINGADLIGETLTNPVTGNDILLLPASFVDTSSGSGLVMSVPAHAPYDWISLKDLQENEELLEEYGIDPEQVKEIEPISIIDVEGYGDIPAKEACEQHSVTSQDDTEKLEKATEEVYKKEFHSGTLNANCQSFAGQTIAEAKQELIQLYTSQGRFSSMWDFSENVVCRCGGEVVVAKTDTWFLEYGDPSWKDKADKCLNQLGTVPKNTRDDYSHAVNWLESWPCIRNFGLGTRLPFDQDFVVEPLSDSTIYMAYYTIKHLIEDLPADSLTQEFFDYIFRGKGPIADVSNSTDVPEDRLKEIRQSFEYWYPLDWNTSANELIQNHLTFFMFHHSALFDSNHWPKGVAAWGMGLLEGKKMSSSKGHVVPADEAIEEYGADTTRFFMFSSCEPWQDFDWRKDEVNRAKNKLETFYNRTLELYDAGVDREKTRIDKYLLSRLNSIILDATEALEGFETRKASLKAFFELNNLVNWYRQRTEQLNTEIIQTVLDCQIRMMAPFIPHLCEELWAENGHSGLVTQADWPEADESLINPHIEYGEQLLKATIKDIQEVAGMVGEFESVEIVLASGWKREAVTILKQLFNEHGKLNIGQAMEQLTAHENLQEHASKLADLVKNYASNPGSLPDQIEDIQGELEVFEEAEDFLKQKFGGADINIMPENVSDHKKAGRALPGKPAIILE